jgi:hypothetical protein
MIIRTSPDNQIDKGDPGDDTQRRFRYQATYAALMSLSMLEDEPEVSCLFCEHWEDVLVKHTDGLFIGIQIKTRAMGKDPFKANDEEVINSLRRFIHLEKTFPDSFKRYVIATNCGFWRTKKNSSNISYLIEIAKIASCEEASSDKHLSQLLNKLVKLSSVDKLFIIQTLKKVDLEDAPGLDDIDSRLFRSLSDFPHVRHLTTQQVKEIANSLVDATSKSSALPRSSPREDYLAILDNPQQKRVSLTIQDKEITPESILDIIKNVHSSISNTQSSTLLRSYNQPSLSELPHGMRKMELKMIAGEISISNIDLAKNHKFSAEYLINQWLFKYGLRKADSQYQHLRSVVWTECQEAHDSVHAVSKPFGTDMLKELRLRLRKRYNQDRSGFFDCNYEHLCGVAGILTEECVVWWSPTFDITSEEIS